MLKFLFIINLFIFIIFFFCSGLSAGIVHNTMKLLAGSYYDFLFVLDIAISVFIFYIVFLIFMIFYYRILLLIIKDKENNISVDVKNTVYCINTLRIMIDYTIVNLAHPITVNIPNFIKLLGAHNGKNLILTGKIYNADLIDVGDNVVIAEDSVVSCHSVDGEKLILKKVKLGNNVTLGGRSIILPGVEVGDNSLVGAGAIVTKDSKIPSNEVWGGIPAKKIKNLERM